MTPRAQISIALVIGGRGAYPCPEIVPVGVDGLVFGVGTVNINEVCDAVDGAGDRAGENSPMTSIWALGNDPT